MAVAAGLALGAQAQDVGTEDWARGLCEAVEEGARLLAENRLAPSNGTGKAALLEALIRASEPSVVFLDEAELAARRGCWWVWRGGSWGGSSQEVRRRRGGRCVVGLSKRVILLPCRCG